MKRITLSLHVSEIEYDVQNRTYNDGKWLQAGGKMAEGASAMITDEESNAHVVRRCVQDALGKIFSAVSEYVEAEIPEVTNVMMDDGVVEFSIVMPDQFPMSAAAAAVGAMHEYVSNEAMAGWYESVDATKHNARSKAAAEKLQAVRTALNRRNQYARCMRKDMEAGK